MRNHVKLEICLFVMNFNSGEVFNRVVETGCGLGRSLGDCRTAVPEEWKYQMVKTQTESMIGWQLKTFEPPTRATRKAGKSLPYAI